MSKLSLQTISGRFIFMSILFTAVVSTLAVLTAVQNSNARESLAGIQQVRVPVRLIAGNLIGSLDRVMSQQRGYMLSGNPIFKEERARVYDDDIYPSVEALEDLKGDLDKENSVEIDLLKVQVKEFEEVQNEILEFFEANMLPHMLKLDQVGFEDRKDLTNVFIAKFDAEREISDRIKRADNIRGNLLTIVTRLRNDQEAKLNDSMSSVASGMTRAMVVLIALSIFIFIFLLVFTSLNIWFLRKSIQKPVALINTLATGALPEKIEETKDELNEIVEAAKKLTTNIETASHFALAIGEGRLNYNYTIANNNDILGKSLLQMRERLQKVAADEKKRNWSTAGIAELGNILRNNSGGADSLYLNLLSFVIKYVNANQGALYLVENSSEEYMLRMVSSYAYGKRKYIDHEVYPGEGLIGQAYLEKDLIYLREVPEHYVRITSGLGDAPPRTILISPLIVNDEVYGVLEMAAFAEFEDHVQSFIRTASEQIGSVLATVRSAERTAELLRDSQQQTEELRSQEEEMRQNMEELSATQEEMARKEKEYMRRIQILENKASSSETAHLVAS